MKRLAYIFALLAALVGCGTDATEVVSLDDLSAVASDELGAPVAPESVASQVTIDEDLQRALEHALAERVPDTGGRFVASAAVVEVQTGSIVAYGVSSPNRFGNLLDQQRPSGSTLKLVVNVAAAQAGIHADDGVIGGRNCDFPDGSSAPADGTEPVMSVRRATAISSNCAFGKLTRVIGPDRVADTVRALGIERSLDASTRFATGANTVSLRELLGVGATLMGARGTVEPSIVGGSIESREVEIGSDVRSVVMEMTSDVVTAGTAAGHELDGWQVSAKTGTAARATDAWMFGGTTEFVAAVWMGNPSEPDDSMSDGGVGGRPTVHGGDIPADIWLDLLEYAHRDLEPALVVAEIPLDREPVVVVDGSVDCTSSQDLIRQGPPGPTVTWIETGGPVTC